jgi:FAD/FMN-containing dehydrogenase/Fe-S oxidoreductase
MDAQRQRIHDDLRGLVKGDVLCDDISLQLYSSDASIYEIRPLGIVRPLGTQDVAATLQYACENRIAIHARGGGTGLAGESLGAGIVLDFSRYMRRILESGADWVRVQPGLTHARLNRFLRQEGRQFGPDPSNSVVTTMGSVISVDSGGSHWLRYGSARRHVRSLQIVLADGKILEVAVQPLSGTDFDPQSRAGKLASELAEILSRESELIRSHQPQTVVNCSGYDLVDVLQDGAIHFPKLLTGSEGTLAIITEATLATQPLPRNRGLVLLHFERLDYAARAVLEILPYSPSACDLMDRRHLSLAKESNRAYDALIPQETEAMLLVEFDGQTPAEVREQLALVAHRVVKRKKLAFHSVQAQAPDEVELYWRLAQKTVPRLFRMRGAARPLPFIEDMAVPPKSLSEFLLRLQNVLKHHQVTASLFAHAGHGQLHVRPILDLSNPDDVARIGRLASDVYSEVIGVGGTISGEHADGLSRTQFIRQQYGPLVEVFAEVKRLFDPDGILNPNKILSDDPRLLTRNLRPSTLVAAGLLRPEPEDRANDTVNSSENPVGEEPQYVDLQLNWTLDEMATAARNCNGCGACRSQLEDVRMCPVFHFAPAEEASPRAKANLMRAILGGRLPVSTLASEEFIDVAKLCVHCHMCRLECPANVDIPKLMVEAKAAYVRVNGLSKGDYWLANIDRLSRWGSLLAPLANWAIRNRSARWIMERVFGIARNRKLPMVASRTFMRLATRRRWTRSARHLSRKVLFFVDTYANYYDPQLGEALVEILEHNSIQAYVHPEQLSAGMPLISAGAIEPARKLAKHNIKILAEAVRSGYTIVATEPSAALCLTHEYPSLFDDDEARLVADNTLEACTYLWRQHEAGQLRLDLRPVNATVGYHIPCHMKALGTGETGERLLDLIPGLIVHRLEHGCSGMAGVYGLKRENFRASLRAGRGLIAHLRNPLINAGTSQCSTCKLQMEQGTDKPTLHPIKLLALSYGLMPEIESLLNARSEALVVS